MGGVKIGNGAVIGSQAVVAKDIPPYAIAVGNSARVVKYRFNEDTIKKFLAVKWWNWDLEKIRVNIPFMDDVEKFLSLNYSPELEKIPEDEVGKTVLNLRSEGRKIYSFVGDFRAYQPLWRDVVKNFLQYAEKNSVMIFFLALNSTRSDFEELKNFVETQNQHSRTIIVVPPNNGKNFSPYALVNSTHFITTRESTSLECMDYLYGSDVKIISALDEKIFCVKDVLESQKK